MRTGAYDHFKHNSFQEKSESPAATYKASTVLTDAQTGGGARIKYSYQDRFPGLTSQSPADFFALSTVNSPGATPATDSGKSG